MRKTSLAAEKRGLWREFSDYVRERDNWTCITCGKYAPGPYMHAGHIFPGRQGAILFDFEAVNAQCASCNRGLRGNTAVYVERFVARYGEEKFKALVTRCARLKQWTLPEIQALRAALKRGPHEFECLYAEKYCL